MHGKTPFFPGDAGRGILPHAGADQRDVFALAMMHALLSRPDVQLFDDDDAGIKANISLGDIVQAVVSLTDLYQKARALT